MDSERIMKVKLLSIKKCVLMVSLMDVKEIEAIQCVVNAVVVACVNVGYFL